MISRGAAPLNRLMRFRCTASRFQPEKSKEIQIPYHCRNEGSEELGNHLITFHYESSSCELPTLAAYPWHNTMGKPEIIKMT